MHRPILAVEQKRVGVERLHRDRVNALRVLEYGFPVPAHLPLLALIDVLLPRLLVLYVQRIDHKLIGERFAQLHRFQPADVGFPALPVEDVPELSLRDIPGNPAIIIRKKSTVADVRFRIARISFRAQ
ncbi:hypothetical protein SDC9_97616 [bioreactor metagenome]|uniref:Uncharacterized protein n=1 Tax=bioreactor metagenome TaxID=1076179 RepID=A0A645ACI8_9ZZZZ